VALQDPLDATPQLPRPFAVNDPHFFESLFEGGREIVLQEAFDLAGPESMQVQRVLNGDRDGVFREFLPLGSLAIVI